MTTAPEPLLRLRDWSLSRRVPGGEQVVLDSIDLDLWPGCWVAVIGANGSGKSSLLKYLASEESPVSDRAAIMFQDPDEQIFASSVERELTLGRPGLDAPTVLGEYGLGDLSRLDPALISAGQKQRLALAVALAGEPELLLCDEPTALQDPHQAAWVLDKLDRWRTSRSGCLVTATCDRREAARADRLVVLEAGRIVRDGEPAALLDDPVVIGLLGDGRETAATTAWRPEASEAPVLSLHGVACRFAGAGGGFGPLDLELGPGARLGITGANGCGKSTLLAACTGARRPDRGLVRIAGHELYVDRQRDLEHGLALLAPQFPEYLFTRSTVADEIGLDPALADRDVPEFLRHLGLSPAIGPRNPFTLSCGQRRRLALGLVLGSGRRLLLLDEPTAALDRRGRALVLDLLEALPPAAALVIASHDRDFLAAAGCRLFAMGPRATPV
jgi:energy-coupling factor transport system ATP-binding protein